MGHRLTWILSFSRSSADTPPHRTHFDLQSLFSGISFHFSQSDTWCQPLHPPNQLCYTQTSLDIHVNNVGVLESKHKMIYFRLVSIYSLFYQNFPFAAAFTGYYVYRAPTSEPLFSSNSATIYTYAARQTEKSSYHMDRAMWASLFELLSALPTWLLGPPIASRGLVTFMVEDVKLGPRSMVFLRRSQVCGLGIWMA